MLLETIFFYLFAAGVVLSAVGVVFLRNPVHSALSLVLAFVFSACLWLMLQAEFLALILILVYVGAVMTLFLFVVMTINLDADIKKQTFVHYLPFGLLLMALLAALLLFVLKPAHFLSIGQPIIQDQDYSNVQVLGKVLYTHYVYPFELAAVLLLVAIVAAISLNPRQPSNKKTQNTEKQLYIKRADRVRLLSMPTEKKP
ncbi:MAG: NADH-quinone oxidoreductase subunit J [Gammaproteobacteria bacterium]|nr:NADH-quinone oxidoreductase subunit J [Gammaproteobacteria bacterium]